MAVDSSGPPLEALLPGTRVGNLLVEKELGRGGYSTVYLARDVLIGRRVALKMLRPRRRDLTPADAQRFLVEARLVGGLNSPRIVTLHQVHERPGGRWLFEMEYLDGGTLHDQVTAAYGIPPRRALPILRAVLEGLAAAHEAGVLHRDLKPGNVLLGRDGAVKLADFGLALLQGGEGRGGLSAGDVEGTPWYMAPEVLMHEPASVASDLWSVGILVHEMLTGRPAFDEPDIPSVFYAVQNTAPPPLPRDAPRELRMLVNRCLEKDPRARPASARELLDILDRASGAFPAAVLERAAFAAEPAGIAGRGAERARADGLLDAVAGGGARLLLVTGEAGIGKSAFLGELSETARARGFRTVSARAAPVEGLLRPVLEEVRRRRVSPEEPDTVRILPPSNPPSDPGPEAAGGPPAWGLEQALVALASAGPVLVAVADLHHAREDEVMALAEVVARLTASPVLFALECRTDPGGRLPRGKGEDRGPSALGEVPGLERISLGPLAPEALYQVLEHHAAAKVPAEVADRIASRTGGNPLLALELLRHIEESGAMVRDGGELRTTPRWAEASVPRRFREIVEARIGGLDDEDRSLLETAAVDGLEFDGRAVAAAAGLPPLEVLRRLQRLVRSRGILLPREDGYRFAHAMFREVLYEETAPELRREIHRALASHLESRGDPVDPERLGLHWIGAGDRDRARPHLLRAAHAAALRQEAKRCLDLFVMAGIDPASPDPALVRTEGEALVRIAVAFMDAEFGREAGALLQAVEAAHADGGDPEVRAAAAARRADLALRDHGVAGVDRASLEGYAAGLPRGTARGLVLYTLGCLARHRGDLGEAERLLPEGLDLAKSFGDPALEAATQSLLAGIAVLRGRLVEAEERNAEAARASLLAGRPTNAAISEVNRIQSAFEQGKIEGLEVPLERAIRTIALAGMPAMAASARGILADLRFALGDLPGALEASAGALETNRRSGSVGNLLSSLVGHAILLQASGSTEEALALLGETRDLAANAGNFRYDELARAVECLLRAAIGDLQGANQIGYRALERTLAGEDDGWETLLFLAQATPFGVSEEVLRVGKRLLPRIDRAASTMGRVVHEAFAAAWAVASGKGGAKELRRGADALKDPGIGSRRASLALLGRWFAAEGLRREGRFAEAADEAEAGAREAAAGGHPWMEAALLRLLASVHPDAETDERLRRLLSRLSGRVLDPDLRSVMERAWTIRG